MAQVEAKACSKCKVIKSVDNFRKRSDYPGAKYASQCDDCRRRSQREHFQRYYTKYAAQAKRRHQERAQFIRDMKSKPCTDCGGTFPYYVMDFDHRPEEVKLFNIASTTRTWRKHEVLVREINKCDIVCSNCHRIRTYMRKYGSQLKHEYTLHAFEQH